MLVTIILAADMLSIIESCLFSLQKDSSKLQAATAIELTLNMSPFINKCYEHKRRKQHATAHAIPLDKPSIAHVFTCYTWKTTHNVKDRTFGQKTGDSYKIQLKF